MRITAVIKSTPVLGALLCLKKVLSTGSNPDSSTTLHGNAVPDADVQDVVSRRDVKPRKMSVQRQCNPPLFRATSATDN